MIDEKLADRGARITEQLVKHGAQAAEQCIAPDGSDALDPESPIAQRRAISAKGNNLRCFGDEHE